MYSFVECGEGSNSVTTSSKSPIAQSSKSSKGPTPEYPRPRVDREIGDYMYGSESDDFDEDEDEIVTPLPRVLSSVLDTPLDPEPEQPASASSLSEGFHVSSDAISSQDNDQMQPVDLFHFVWSQYPDSAIPSCERREQFTQERVGPVEPCYDPYKIFTQIWDDSIINHIVNETNSYAQQLISHRIAINHWQDTCVDEMYVFFAIILATGLVINSKLEEYWSNNGNIFATPGFHEHMTLKRFQLLSMCIHFNNNIAMSAQELTPSEVKIFKIQPIITHLNQKFQAMYIIDQNIALDESLLQWKGYLSINQVISNKVAKIGIKTYEVCESKTGYLWRFVVHSHDRVIAQAPQSPLEAVSSGIVKDLL